ncbi:PREDICTED: GTP-binding protein RAD [Chinchilla lanigera]|nr:PREDICTED: GTP-binding protein RAD [Chinchilla lanigera]
MGLPQMGHRLGCKDPVAASKFRPGSLLPVTYAAIRVSGPSDGRSVGMTLNGSGARGTGGSRAGTDRERRRGSTPWGAAPLMHRRSMPVDDRDLQAALTPGVRGAGLAGSSSATQGARLDWAEGSSDSLSSGGSSSEESIYKVLLLGASGVGKSALARIFGGVEDGPEAEAAGKGTGCSGQGKISRLLGRKERSVVRLGAGLNGQHHGIPNALSESCLCLPISRWGNSESPWGQAAGRQGALEWTPGHCYLGDPWEGQAHHALRSPAPSIVSSVAHSSHVQMEGSIRLWEEWGGCDPKGKRAMEAFDSQPVTCLLAYCLGHTYDRSIMVDGEEASLMVYDIWEQDGSRWLPGHCMAMGDAYVIVYSVTDKASFEKASELRVQLRRARQTDDIPIILVGNKSDLVRSREVSVDEGRACAVVFDCKFIETSAALHHNVQALFEGVVRQIRLRRDSKEANARRQAGTRRRESLGKKAKRFLGRIVARNSRKMAFRAKSKSCHDLSVL